MEQQLSPRLREGEIAELVENDEVEARQIIGEAPLTARSGLGLEPVDGVKKAATLACAI